MAGACVLCSTTGFASHLSKIWRNLTKALLWTSAFSASSPSFSSLMPVASIKEGLAAFASGEFLIVIDDPTRENEGDLIISAAHVTTQKMAFMIRYTSGLICVPMSSRRLDQLELPDMVIKNEESLRTAYTVSCDAREGVTTGISAADRAHTANVLADSATVSIND